MPEWLEGFPVLPTGLASGAFALLMWLIKRGDSNLRSDIAELRDQRDAAWRERDAADARADAAEARADEARARINRLETELVLYRRAHGPLDGTETP